MKTMKANLIKTIIMVAFTSVFFQNCSQPVNFEAEADLASNVNEQTTDTNSDDGSETAVPVQDEIQAAPTYPKLAFESKVCAAGEICEIMIYANEPVPKEISGSWKTNDVIWETDPQFYARPNYHFVPTSGIFKIQAGKKSTVLRITSLNWDNHTNKVMTVNVPISVFQCKYDQRETPCSLFFQ